MMSRKASSTLLFDFPLTGTYIFFNVKKTQSAGPSLDFEKVFVSEISLLTV